MRAHRRRLGLTQEELAERAGMSVRAVRRIESGQVAVPRSRTVRLLADALGLAAADQQRFQDAGMREPEPVPPGLLPAPVPRLVGRDASLRALDAALAHGPEVVAHGSDAVAHGSDAAPVIAVTGMAGVGKTTLALHWANRVAAGFPGGQLFVDLRGFDTARPMRAVDAVAELLREAGMPPAEVPADHDEAIGAYRRLLQRRRMLVVLDNARDAEHVRPLLPGVPGCLTLVTSRDRLTGLVALQHATRIELDVLSADASIALLTPLLGARGDAEVTGRLAEACGHLPLALRIGGALLADRPGRDLDGYIAELRAGTGVATLQITGDAAASVGSAFMLSYEALPGSARRLFRLLGDVPGPTVPAAAVTALTGSDPPLERLLAAHLIVEPSPGRFALHDLLRRFARALPEESPGERAAARIRLLAWYLATARSAVRLAAPQAFQLPFPDDLPAGVAFADAITAAAWLDAELRNVVALAVDAAEHGPARLSWLIADAMRGHLALRRPGVEWLDLAHAGLAAAEREHDALGQAAMQLSLGQAHRWRSRFDAARDHLHAAETLARTAGWPQGEASAVCNLGVVHAELGETRVAADRFAEAIRLYRSCGLPASETVARANLAALKARLGQFAESNREAAAAQAFYRATGDRNGEAMMLVNLGCNHTHLGDFDRGAEHLRLGLDIHTTFGDRYGMTVAHLGLAEHDLATGRLTTAAEHAGAGLALATEIDDVVDAAQAHALLSRIRCATGDAAAAATHAAEALALAHRSGSAEAEINALTALAELGPADHAIDLATQAAARARTRGYTRLEARALEALATAHLATGHPTAAATAARAALQRHEHTGDRPGAARARTLLARPAEVDHEDSARVERMTTAESS